jgi:hypothetical protein
MGARPAPRRRSMLVNAPQPKKRGAALAAAILGAVLLAAGGYWIMTDDDSLADKIKGWGDQVSALFATQGTPSVAPAETQQSSGPETAQPASGKSASGSSPSGTRTAQTPSAHQNSPANQNSLANQNTSANPNVSPTPRSSPAQQAAQPAAAARVAAAPATVAPASRAEPAAAVNQASAHIEMASDTVEVPATETTAIVVVRRRGNLRGGADFKWWTESGTAKPATDFTPATPRVEEIPNGRNSVALSIPVSNRPRSQARSFYVVIDQTESGATLGARTLTMVTLLPSD